MRKELEIEFMNGMLEKRAFFGGLTGSVGMFGMFELPGLVRNARQYKSVHDTRPTPNANANYSPNAQPPAWLKQGQY